ncbi:MAG: D-alanyl-D-alanine carboxypeptidase family protein, partial [Patescibacteria group bacterium]
NPDKPLLPASTTKIITALIAMDYYRKDAVVRVGRIKTEGQRMGLIFGEEITVDSLLKGLLIASANDAAEVLAQGYPGGKEAFVAAMNRKATEVNLDNTNFTNPSGFDTVGHFSTARDLVRISSHAMQIPYFSEIVGTGEALVESVDGRFVHKLVNVNELVGEVEGVLGVKTGWTENARENLVTYVERDGRRVMIAVLGSQDRFGETKELIDWIFENYEWVKLDYPHSP